MLRSSLELLATRFHAENYTVGRSRASSRRMNAPNIGLVGRSDKGDAFTTPGVYRNKTNPTLVSKVPKKINFHLDEQQFNRLASSSGVSAAAQIALDRGDAAPKDAGAKRLADALNQRDLGLRDSARAPQRSRQNEFSRVVRDAFDRDEMKREAFAHKHAQSPNAEEYRKLLRGLQKEDANDERIDELQSKLANDHGILPTHRVDAFMLDDDSLFPEWVQQLPFNVRDRVKYGNMGLTEDDEATRVRLGRLPIDQRISEWKRQKSARAYLESKEKPLSPTELRDIRLGKRTFHWLQRKRQRRATALKRLALRKPEQFESWPSEAVDYSRRLSMIAQHVENGVATHGQWPLNAEELSRAKLRKRQEDAERTFMATVEEKRALRKHMSGSVAETLRRMDSDEEKPIRRLSSRTFANRVNAVKHGDQDARGRRYRELATGAKTRLRSWGSETEKQVEAEIRDEPTLWKAGAIKRDNAHWYTSRQDAAYGGIPSTRYSN